MLHVDEIESLPIKAKTIILSACETASGNGRPGAETLSGFAQAFFYSGAQTILATQWKVESVSASLLMIHAMQANSQAPDMAERLRQSMLRLRAQKKFSHPAYWAPFVTVDNIIFGGALHVTMSLPKNHLLSISCPIACHTNSKSPVHPPKPQKASPLSTYTSRR